MIPLFVDCSGRRVVIFGGGAVATRKAAYFAEEARVLVVSRSFAREMEMLPVEKQTLDLRTASDDAVSSLIGDAFLAIGALSDPAQNSRIGRLCRTKGILYNNADGTGGDVILPGISRGNHVTIAISTGGSSPAVSRFIRQHLDQELPELDAMIVLQHRLRQALKKTETGQAGRDAILHTVLEDPAVWSLLKTEPDKAWDTVAARYLHG